ncbi:unnamed protein product [Pleuronectes platessa]|uniref:Uncharacterized protein n=1 Tax=Pleuronectes platessa TaxID=8262 RepID=A0A9N7ZDI0_PLEPL|nr:unnamed protein product [Pleuronectes platessa]
MGGTSTPRLNSTLSLLQRLRMTRSPLDGSVYERRFIGFMEEMTQLIARCVLCSLFSDRRRSRGGSQIQMKGPQCVCGAPTARGDTQSEVTAGLRRGQGNVDHTRRTETC